MAIAVTFAGIYSGKRNFRDTTGDASPLKTIRSGFTLLIILARSVVVAPIKFRYATPFSAGLNLAGIIVAEYALTIKAIRFISGAFSIRSTVTLRRFAVAICIFVAQFALGFANLTVAPTRTIRVTVAWTAAVLVVGTIL